MGVGGKKNINSSGGWVGRDGLVCAAGKKTTVQLDQGWGGLGGWAYWGGLGGWICWGRWGS